VNPDRDFLLDIVELIETIERRRPESEAQLLEDEVLLTAIIHWVQTIGEAANGVSVIIRAEHPQVPWREIVDMRNLLAHGYRHVDPAIVWQVVVRDLPRSASRMLASSSASGTYSPTTMPPWTMKRCTAWLNKTSVC
jgi:uncharacterized protein with HEPN domain